MTRRHDPQEGARRAREAGYEVAELVYDKQLAYGDAASIQRGLWGVLLEQYKHGHARLEEDRPGEVYEIPVALIDHIPRLTRVFDRIARLVSNPGQDALGEDPWVDLAGDAIVGIIMPRAEPPQDNPDIADLEAEAVAEKRLEPCPVRNPATGADCERGRGHPGEHRAVHAGGTQRWTTGDSRVDYVTRAEANDGEPDGPDGDQTGAGFTVPDQGGGVGSHVDKPRDYMKRNKEGSRPCGRCRQYKGAEAYDGDDEWCRGCRVEDRLSRREDEAEARAAKADKAALAEARRKGGEE